MNAALNSHGPPLPSAGGREVARDPFPLPRELWPSSRDFAQERAEAVNRGLLPSPPGYLVPARVLTGRCRKRANRRGAIDDDCHRCLASLNALYGGPSAAGGGPAPSGGPSAVQQKVLDHVRLSVRALGPPPTDCDQLGALRALQLRLPYDDVSGGPVCYDPSRVSLPEAGTRQSDLSSLWGDGGAQIVRDFISTKILPRVVASRRLATDGPTRAYGDPRLRSLP